MGLTLVEWLGIMGFIFAICSFILTLILNRIKGPQMAIYDVEHLSNTLTSMDLYNIKFRRCVQNYGDLPENITEEPEIIVYDINDNILEIKKNSKERFPIAAGYFDCRHRDFVMSKKAENWHHATIKFNAIFYNKRRKRTELKNDSFPIENNDYKTLP